MCKIFMMTKSKLCKIVENKNNLVKQITTLTKDKY